MGSKCSAEKDGGNAEMVQQMEHLSSHSVQVWRVDRKSGMVIARARAVDRRVMEVVPGCEQLDARTRNHDYGAYLEVRVVLGPEVPSNHPRVPIHIVDHHGVDRTFGYQTKPTSPAA